MATNEKELNISEDTSSEYVPFESNISQDIIDFNAALKQELQSALFKSNLDKEDAEILNLLVTYKPTSDEEFDKIKQLEEFTNASKAISTINNMLKKFKERYEDLFVVEVDERYALENVYLRNIDINEENNLINVAGDKNATIIDPTKSFAKDDIKNIAKGLIESFVSDEQTNFEIEKTAQIEELFESQEQIRSILRRYPHYAAIGKITGNIKSELINLKVDAPALLVPLKLIEVEDETKFELKADTERQIILNKDVIVALQTSLQENYQSFDYKLQAIIDRAENLVYDDMLSEIKILFQDYGLEFNEGKEKTKFDFDDNLLIGAFNVNKNPTMFDLRWMVTNGFITDNIKQIFSNEDSQQRMDMILGNLSPEVEARKRELISKNEYDIAAISKLNYPQETAVRNVNVHRDLVIQGPPGTGKTETITSIISDAVLRNQKVLVSSEKDVALEVIYTRLRELAKYSILLTNIEDSVKFYDQLQDMLADAIKDKADQANSSLIMNDNEISFRRYETRKQIIEFIKTYETIFKYLRTNEIGKTYSDLYKNHSTYRTTEKDIQDILDQCTTIDVIKNNKLLIPKLYDVLYMLNEKFSNKSNVDDFDIDKAVLDKYPFLITHTKKNITIAKINKVTEKLESFSTEQMFNGHKFSSKLNSILGKVFKDPEHLYSYISNMGELKVVIDILERKVNMVTSNISEGDSSEIYNALGSAWMLTYDEIVEKLVENNKKINPKQISGLIFDHTIKQILILKESSNTELQSNISNGNISTFNKMISKGLTEIVEFNVTLSERRLRDGLLNVMAGSGKMTEIQSYIENNKHDNINKFLSDHWREVFQSVNVWLLPSNEVSLFFPLEPGLFDLVVIDEASQMQVEKALPLLYRGKKLVISGDDKQLKPSIDPRQKIYWNERELKLKDALIPPYGLQDALKNKLPNFLINYHYRSKFEELISFSNAFLYKNKLYVSTPKTYDPDNTPVEWHNVKGRMVKNANQKEATEIVKRVVELINENPDASIGIIAFTHEQKLLVDKELVKVADKTPALDLFIRTNAFDGEGEDNSLFVKEVSEVQGDERDIILFSIGFAKGSNGKLPTHLGAISEPFGENRLNVAITRAKSKNIVFASVEPGDLTLSPNDIGGNLLKHFFYYAEAVQNGDKRSVARILKRKHEGETKVFESQMHEEIFTLIKSAGYDVEYKYGMDNYKLDFVIKNEIGDIVLAIELDNEQYLRNFNTMEREYYLPTYLEARGWNLLKVWSHQWSKDPIQENARILERIKKELENSGGDIVSLYENNEGQLDYDLIEDFQHQPVEDEIKEVISEGERLIEERMNDLSEIRKILKSNKEQLEEDKWMAEFEALDVQNKSNESNTDLDDLIEREFILDPDTKLVDGIEDPEIDELIKLSEIRKKK